MLEMCVLEVLFAERELDTVLALQPRLFPQRLGHSTRSTEENRHIDHHFLSRAWHIRPVCNSLPQLREDGSEIGASKVGQRPQTSDGVSSREIVVHVQGNVVVLVGLHDGGTVDVNLEMDVAHRSFNSGQEGLEPFQGGQVAADPVEFDPLGFESHVVVGAVPDVAEDTGERCDTDAGTDKDNNLVVEDVFCGGAEGSVDPDGGHTESCADADLLSTVVDQLCGFLGFGLVGRSSGSLATTSTVSFTLLLHAHPGSERPSPVSSLSNMNRDIIFKGRRRNRKRMPLVLGELRHVDKHILARLILERRFLNLQFDDSCRVLNGLDKSSLQSGTVEADTSLNNVEDIADEQVLVGLISTTDTVLVLDNTSNSVEHQRSEHDERQMVGIPERLKRLVTLRLLGGRVHQDHTQEHNMSCHTGGRLVKQLSSTLWKTRVSSHMQLVHLEDVNIMTDRMNDCTDDDRVGRNLVEPDVLIDGNQLVKEGDTEDTEDVSTDGEEDDGAIPDKTDTATTGDPERVVEGFVEVDEIIIIFDTEDTKNEEDDMEDKPGYEEDVTTGCPRL